MSGLPLYGFEQYRRCCIRSARLGFMAICSPATIKTVFNLEALAAATSQHNGMRVGGALNFKPAMSKSWITRQPDRTLLNVSWCSMRSHKTVFITREGNVQIRFKTLL